MTIFRNHSIQKNCLRGSRRSSADVRTVSRRPSVQASSPQRTRQSNIRGFGSTRHATSYMRTTSGSRCRPKSLNCCSSSPPTRTGFLQESNCWEMYGAMISMGNPARWMSMSNGSGRNWTPSAASTIGKSRLFGELDINLKSHDAAGIKKADKPEISLPEEKRRQAQQVVSILAEAYPDADCTLDYQEPWKLLISGILAAQCTDARVNIVCSTLFVEFPTIESFAKAEIPVLEDRIRSCGFFHMKAKAIKGSMNKILSDFGGQVPSTLDALTQLPGVGRKIGNLILGDCFGMTGCRGGYALFEDFQTSGAYRLRGPCKDRTGPHALPSRRIMDKLWTSHRRPWKSRLYRKESAMCEMSFAACL